jgi:uncharacterized protein YidB (DUF937 family)
MALLDDLVGSVVTAVAGERAPSLNQFLKDNGGVSGLADKFQKGGAGEMFASWVSTRENQAITASEIEKVIGNERVQEMARKLGVDPAQASAFIASTLPAVIDRLTPEGKLPDQPPAPGS